MSSSKRIVWLAAIGANSIWLLEIERHNEMGIPSTGSDHEIWTMKNIQKQPLRSGFASPLPPCLPSPRHQALMIPPGKAREKHHSCQGPQQWQQCSIMSWLRGWNSNRCAHGLALPQVWVPSSTYIQVKQWWSRKNESYTCWGFSGFIIFETRKALLTSWPSLSNHDNASRDTHCSICQRIEIAKQPLFFFFWAKPCGMLVCIYHSKILQAPRISFLVADVHQSLLSPLADRAELDVQLLNTESDWQVGINF